MKTVIAAAIMAVIAYASLFVMLNSEYDYSAWEQCTNEAYEHNLAFQQGKADFRIYCTNDGRRFRLENEDPSSQPIWLD